MTGSISENTDRLRLQVIELGRKSAVQPDVNPAIVTVFSILGATALAQNQRGADHGPSIGQEAPQIRLTLLKDDAQFDMASNYKQRPTVLIFGSYT